MNRITDDTGKDFHSGTRDGRTGAGVLWFPWPMLAIFLTVCLLPAGSARADVTQMDLQVTARALSFIEPPMSGQARMGIIYAPGDPASSRQADDVSRLMGEGLRVGNLELVPVPVPLTNAGNANVDFYFLLEGLGERAEMVNGAVRARQVPCLTTDIEQVRAGRCVMGIQSAPEVEILLNRHAADASGTRFARVFRMMITEL